MPLNKEGRELHKLREIVLTSERSEQSSVESWVRKWPHLKVRRENSKNGTILGRATKESEESKV